MSSFGESETPSKSINKHMVRPDGERDIKYGSNFSLAHKEAADADANAHKSEFTKRPEGSKDIRFGTSEPSGPEKNIKVSSVARLKWVKGRE